MNAIDVIKTELACVQRDCCRIENQCAKCDLVLPVEEIISAYRKCISLLEHEEQIAEEKIKSNYIFDVTIVVKGYSYKERKLIGVNAENIEIAFDKMNEGVSNIGRLEEVRDARRL